MSDKQNKPVIKTLSIKSPYGGWVSDPWDVPSAALQGNADPTKPSQYTNSSGASLFRKEKMGHIGPAEIFNVGSLTDGSVNINSLPRAVAVDVTATPNVYWYITGGISGTAPRLVSASTTATTSSHAITAPVGNFTTIPTSGTGFWGEDIIFYTANLSNVNTPMILYSYSDSSTGAVGMYSITGASVISDDFFSTTYFSGSARPTANVPHRFCEGNNHIVYMTNGQYLASYDGSGASNGTLTVQALNCGAGWITVDVCKYQNYIAVLCVKNGTSFNQFTSKSEAKVLLWDGTNAGANAAPNFVYDVQDNYASALFNSDQLYCFSQGINNTTKIKALPISYGVSKLQTIYENSTTAIGNAPDPRSVGLYNGNIVWWGTSPNTAGAVNAYMPGVGFHQPYIASDGTNVSSTNGLVGNIASNKLFIGMKSGSTYKVSYLDGTGGSYNANPDFRTALLELPYRSTIKAITFYFSQFAASSSLLVSFFKDYSAISIGGATDQLNFTINSNTPPASTFLAYRIVKTIPDVSSFYMNFRFNHTLVSDTAAIIREVVIEYEPVAKP